MTETSVLLDELTWQEVKEALEKSDLIILPIASVEQHGYALPLGTDSFNIAHVAKLAAERTGVLVTPTVKFGVSHNHIDFCGTLTVSSDTLIALIMDLVKSLRHHGFRRILLLNGHGGNNATIDVAAIKCRMLYPDTLIGHAYSGALHREASRKYNISGIVYHADEGETARALYSWPHLVKIDRAVREVTPAFQSYYENYCLPENKGSLAGMVSYGLPPTRTLTNSGTMGDATVATVENGKKIVEEQVENLVRVIEDMKRLLLPDAKEV